MPYKNNRNSREDKSLKHNRFEGNSKNERTKRDNSEKNKMFEGGRKTNSSARFKPSGQTSREDRKQTGSRPYGTRSSQSDTKEPRPFGGRNTRKNTEERDFEKKTGFRQERNDSFEKRPFKEKRKDRDENYGEQKRRTSGKSAYGSERKAPSGERSFERKPYKTPGNRRKTEENRKWTSEERVAEPRLRSRKGAEAKEDELIRLNRYIANAGICSRRKADELIEAGVITVNEEVVSELGHKVNPVKDVIRYNGETLRREKMVYVLLNKPKDYITTTDDPQERKTVMHLVEKASSERIYPVGRLDRNTTGLLLMTNDGDLAEKLSHPRNNIIKIYQIELNKNLTQGDLNKIAFGLELEDGFIKPDAVSYVQGGTKREVGIQIHSGKNRIVRRIFEHLGYEVVKLDRVVYANLTKKDLPRGRWRYLEEKEVIQLKHFIK